MDIPSILLPAEKPSDLQHSYTQRSAADIAQEHLWNELSALYSANDTMKTDAAILNPASTSTDLARDSDTAQKLDQLLNSFINGANSVLEELTALGNAHPALALAIFAFHEVIKLDIARRDNSKKVLVVILQMQSVLGPMFQLRNLDRSHMPEAERNFHEGRLLEAVEIITRDINQCRSDIMHFMERKSVYKLVLAKGYEKKFAGHMDTFSRRRTELQSIISEYIAISVSTANIAISQVGAKVDNVDAKLDQIISTIFRNLDTTREKDVFKFIEQHGGPEKCVNDLNLLPKLVSKAGEAPKTGKVTISDPAELEELRTALSAALKEDLDKVLERHYSRFEKILQVQSNNLKHISSHLEDQGALMQTHTVKLGKILDTVTTIMIMGEGKFKTKEFKFKDPEIHEIWTRMNLGTSSVKAKVFVLTFRDHIRAGNSAMATPVQGSVLLPTGDEASNTLQFLNPTNPETASESEWVYEYIDVAYVQPIVDAMDEDGSGFISVKEANTFALSRDRPKDMKLLSWVAYWAAGWHINLTKYQKEIYSILLRMHDTLPQLHVGNRIYVNDFLDERVIRRVEALCRSLKPLPNNRRDPKLLAVAENVASWQLERLKTNLSNMGFMIETPFVAKAVSGSSRVETWIFPVLCLLLGKYLDIVKLAKNVVLDPDEFQSHVTSLISVFSAFDERKEILEARFSQLHSDVDAQFCTFSYGMFYAAHKQNEFETPLNTLLAQRVDECFVKKEAPEKGKVKGVPPDTSILSKPPCSGLELVELDLLPSLSPSPEHVPHPIEGNWFGWSSWPDSNTSHMSPHRCVIHPVIDNKLIGRSESFFGALDLVGSVRPDPVSGKIQVRFELIPEESDWRAQACEGVYDPVRDTVEGTFGWTRTETSAGEQTQSDATSDADSEVIMEEDRPSNISAEGDKLPDGNTLSPPMNDSSSPVATDIVQNADVIEVASEMPIQEVWEETETSSEETSSEMGNTPDYRFCFTRTPPHLFRFRTYLDGPGPAPCWASWSMARKRWVFAIEAVRYEKRGFKKAITEALAERQSYLYYTMRCNLTDSSFTPHSGRFAELTEKEWREWDALTETVHPSTARIWEQTAHFMTRRDGGYNVGRWLCDQCNYNITFIRHICIECINDNSHISIDLCLKCIDMSRDLGRSLDGCTTHLASHSFLRLRTWLHPYELNTLIPEARLISEQCKRTFRDLENAKEKVEPAKRMGMIEKRKASRKTASSEDAEGSVDVVQPICTSCDKKVSLPCWVCLECSPLLFVCMTCDRKVARIKQSEHSVVKHHLILIHDSIEVKIIKEGKRSEMERRFDNLETSIRDLADVKLIVEDMAKTMGFKDDTKPPGALAASAEEEKQPSLDKDDDEVNPIPNNSNEDEELGEEGNADTKGQPDLRDQLAALETRVDSIVTRLAQEDKHGVAALESRIDAMEANVNQKLEALLALLAPLQNLAALGGGVAEN